jgi:hypothetical protein
MVEVGSLIWEWKLGRGGKVGERMGGELVGIYGKCP